MSSKFQIVLIIKTHTIIAGVFFPFHMSKYKFSDQQFRLNSQVIFFLKLNVTILVRRRKKTFRIFIKIKKNTRGAFGKQ